MKEYGTRLIVILPPIPDEINKSYISAHYRHGPNGQLIFVHGYTNKVIPKPEELTAPDVAGQPLSDPQQPITSFHVGDEVFVKYSHMHDQHFLTGLVVGVRKDKWHKGKLVLVKEPTGVVEAYAPASLAHVRKVHHELRQHEKEPHVDDKGVFIPYQHLSDEQMAKFHDLHRLWYRLHRMGEILAFQQNQSLFAYNDKTGKAVHNKMDMSDEQRIELEKLNPFPVVPVEKLVNMIADSNYNDGAHFAAVKKLLAEIKNLTEKGAPTITFPKLYAPKVSSSKKITVEPPSYWFHGQFPLEVTEEKPDEQALQQLQFDIASATGMLPTSSSGVVPYNVDVAYAGGVYSPSEHGAVMSYVSKYDLPQSKTQSAAVSEQKLASATPSPSSDFTVIGEANVGGMHTKYLLKGSDGHEYLFKPYRKWEAFRAYADIIPARIAEAIGLPTALVGATSVNVKIPYSAGGDYAGKTATGSVQKLINAEKNNIAHYTKNDFAEAPQWVLEALQKEHVLDWLVGNNDAKPDQFVESQGKIIGVDKGQSFRFYEQDVLALDYNPNFEINGQKNLYNEMLEAAKNGKIKLDWNITRDFIHHLHKNLSPSKFVSLITDFGNNSPKWQGKRDLLEHLAVSRYKNLEDNFHNLYQQAGVLEYDEAEKKFLEAAKQPVYQANAFMNIDEHFHAKVVNSGKLGHSIPLGGGDIEDMNVLFTHYKWSSEDSSKKGKQGLMITCKVLAGSEAKLLDFFPKAQDHHTHTHHYYHELPDKYDPIYYLVNSTKDAINKESKNEKFDEYKIKKFLKTFTDKEGNLLDVVFVINKLTNNLDGLSSPASMAVKLASFYEPRIKRLYDAIKNNTKVDKDFSQRWAGEYEIVSDPVGDKNVELARFPEFKTDKNGEIIREPIRLGLKYGEVDTLRGEKEATFPSFAEHLSFSGGAMFRRSLPGNIEVRYYPHANEMLFGQNNLRSQQGKLIIDLHDWDGSFNKMNAMRSIFKIIGLDDGLSTHTDLECLYLTKIAWQQKADIDYPEEWNEIKKMPNDDKKIAKLRSLCKMAYGSVSPEELEDYSPTPIWDQAGHFYFLNPYTIDAIRKEKPTWLLRHTINSLIYEDGGKKLAESIVHDGLLSTEERHRIDLKSRGFSSIEDQGTGGASYAFVNKLSNTKLASSSFGVILDPMIMARTDSFGYDTDRYGSTHDHAIRLREKILDLIKNTENEGNIPEIMFKHRISLKRWLSGIYKNERNHFVKHFLNALKTLAPEKLHELQVYLKDGKSMTVEEALNQKTTAASAS